MNPHQFKPSHIPNLIWLKTNNTATKHCSRCSDLLAIHKQRNGKQTISTWYICINDPLHMFHAKFNKLNGSLNINDKSISRIPRR